MSNRHLPQRTCIACRRTDDKTAFIRLARTGDGLIQIDTSGKKPGRGAYLCRQRACWEMALKKNRLGHALRTALSDDDVQGLTEYCCTLLEEGQT